MNTAALHAAVGSLALGCQGQAELTRGASPAPVSGCWKDTGGLKAEPVLKQQEEPGWENPTTGEERPWPSPGASPQGSGEHNAFVCDLACTRSPSLPQPQNTNPSKGLFSPSPSPSNANVPGLFS